MKGVILLITIITIAFISYFIFSQIKKSGKQEEKIECINQQIIMRNEVIKETKQVQKRRVINRSVPTSDNINWLYNNRCSDCKN